MPIHYGTVKGNAVILSRGIALTEGMRVEVRTPSPECTPTEEPEEQFQQRLLELGLITEIKKPCPHIPLKDPVLVHVKGQPLSEMIIEERR